MVGICIGVGIRTTISGVNIIGIRIGTKRPNACTYHLLIYINT